MKGLYIGKFQPFHNGHVKAFEILNSFVDEVVIGLGSPKISEQFDLTERIQMIKVNTGIEPIILEDLGENHPDYFDWGNYVIGRVGKINVVATGNKDVRDDFIKQDIPVIWMPRFANLSRTEIRKRISNQDDTWRELVPLVSAEIIETSSFYRRYN